MPAGAVTQAWKSVAEKALAHPFAGSCSCLSTCTQLHTAPPKQGPYPESLSMVRVKQAEGF